ncbi:Multicopper oxidase, N-terminal [Dillenia turbinata]|uniref:Laccase n=1 Tax=Dillenia turbinata TaxID=194707 RepID=A0AAN8ZJF9_9MAGN
MGCYKSSLVLELLSILLIQVFFVSLASKNVSVIDWVIKEANYTRLCSTKEILTVNGLFPGPALHLHAGDTLKVNVHNEGTHGVKQPRNPWSDGPEYVTQCPIKAGKNFTYEIILSNEVGTLWWHAHSDWSRATVHGPLIVYPKVGSNYTFRKPDGEIPIILGSWYKGDVMEIITEALSGGGEPNKSDALTINGQPGDLYNCSKPGTFKMVFDHGKTYLLRIINAIMNEEMFLMVANHTLTLVGTDGAYVKPVESSYIVITPGQTMDVLITADQSPNHYYMAARAYYGVVYDNTTTTAIVKYSGKYSAPSSPIMPSLPDYNDTDAVTSFTNKLRFLETKDHPIDVPKNVDRRFIITIALNTVACPDGSTCVGPDGDKMAASLNNISFNHPEMDILQAYYLGKEGYFTTDFPTTPLHVYNFTMDPMLGDYVTTTQGTNVTVLEFNSTVEIVFQGTNVLNASENHPMHLHGYSFYFVGSDFGNYSIKDDPKKYNLVDPPEVNTIGVPKNGWAAIRFRADNPGVWFMHCHLERHSSWGMGTVFIVKNGTTSSTSMRRPPHYLNPCT